MATFEVQVEGLTSITLTGGSHPTITELSQFLKDGVVDVTNRWLLVRPQDIDNFTRESAEQTSNGFNPGTSKIISVIRESGTDGEWYPCSKKPISLQYLVTDVESLLYASKYNPVYMITQNRNVHVFPAPSTAGNDGFKALYVNYDPEESDGTDLQYDSTGIKWFPDDKVYLVVLYASIKALQSNMGAKAVTAINVTAVPPNSLTAPSFTAGAVSAATAGSLGTAPTYIKPLVSLGAAPTISDLTIAATTPVAPQSPSFSTPTIGYVAVGALGTAPTYTPAFAILDISQLETFLETEEDSELAQVQLGRLQSEISKYQADVQNNLNEFNKENVLYQSTIQEAIQNAQIKAADEQQSANLLLQKENQEYAVSLQKFSAEVQNYQANVAKEVQEYQQNLAGDIQVWQGERTTDLQKYGSDIQNALNDFNKDNVAYQSTVQEALQNLQVAAAKAQKDADLALQAQIQEYASNIQNYQTELGIYQAEVGSQVQEYTQALQSEGLAYKWLEDQYIKLKTEYDQAFIMATPKQQTAQQAA